MFLFQAHRCRRRLPRESVVFYVHEKGGIFRVSKSGRAYRESERKSVRMPIITYVNFHPLPPGRRRPVRRKRLVS